MSVLAWEDPPIKNPNYRWKRATRDLQERPGEWAKLAEDEPPNTLYKAAHRLRAAGCEVETRWTLRRCSLWARWPL